MFGFEWNFYNYVNESTDIAFNWLKAIVPFGAGSPLGAFLGIVCAALLALASLMMVWFVTAGVVTSAQEGKVLGGRWSVTWAPIRVVVGMAFLAPLFNGFNPAMLLIYEIAKWGSMMATAAWAAFASSALVDGEAMPVPAPARGLPVAEAFLEAAVCTKLLETAKHFKTTGNTNHFVGNYDYPSLPGPDPQRVVRENPYQEDLVASGISEIEYAALIAGIEREARERGAPFKTVFDEHLGSLSRGSPEHTALIHYQAAHFDKRYRNQAVWDFGICGQIVFHEDARTPAEKELYERQLEEVSRMYRRMGSVAQNVLMRALPVEGDPRGLARLEAKEVFARNLPRRLIQQLDAIVDDYDRAMVGHASKFAASLDEERRRRLAGNAAELGWLSAGQYYGVLSSISMAAHGHLSREPIFTGINFGAIEQAEYGEGYSRILRLTKQAWEEQAAKARSSLVSLSDFANPAAAAGSVDDRDGNWLTRKLWSKMKDLLNESTYWIASSITDVGYSNTDPMTWLISLGHEIMNAASAIFIGGMGLGFLATNIAGDAAGGTGIFMFVKMPLFIIMAAFYVSGAILAYIIPFIPFIMVALLGAGWIVMVAEAMLAAVIYPFLYIRMDGQDLFDNPQKPGLILIFNIFLRPTLGIGAFCFTFYLLPPIYDFLREHMLNAFFAQSVSSGRVVGGGGIIIGMLLFVYLCWIMTLRLFQLTAEMPDRVARWFGAAPEGLGESQDMSRSTMMMLNIAHRTAMGATGPLGKSVSKKKEKNEAGGGGGNPNE